MSSAADSHWQLPHFDISRKPLAGSALQKHLEELERQAREEGFKQGFDSGFTAAKQEAGLGLESLKKLTEELANYLDILDNQLAEEILFLARDIAARVIGAEITQAPELILNGISEAIAAVDASADELTVRLHPQDHEFIQTLGESVLAPSALHIEVDDSLNRGDCLVSNRIATAEALVKEKINQVTSNLGD